MHTTSDKGLYAKWEDKPAFVEYRFTAASSPDAKVIGLVGGFEWQKDYKWSGTVNGEAKEYTGGIRATGDSGRAISVVLEKGQTAYIHFGANGANKNVTAKMWFGSASNTAEASALGSAVEGTTDGSKVGSGVLSYTAAADGTYYAVCGSGKPCIYSILIK